MLDEITLSIAKMKKATHIIMVCDTFSYEDYPVYVLKGENLQDKVSEYNCKSMQRVMEVIDMKKHKKRKAKKKPK